jgi:L-fuconolactonase
MKRIDAHQHFWRPARGDYAWLRADQPGLAPLLRDFLPGDIQPLLQAAGIGQTVLVQAADTVAETEFLLELAAGHAFIAGVVGWVDLSRSDAVATLERLAQHPKFKGVRPMLQDLPQTDWIARAPHPDAVRALLRLGLRFDALVKPEHLPALLQFVRAWPDLPVVIDHAAKPRLAESWQAEWATGWRHHMAELAALPQVRCKFSGLVTEMPAPAAIDATVDALRPVWESLLRWFGPARILWGSDWPVLTLAASHAQWVAVSETLIGSLAPGEQDLVWQGAARSFYGLA